MSDVFRDFKRSKDYLICIDSDGCAIDTMDIKHIRCFGPCMIEEWGLEPWKDEILKRWNQVNLYTMTRGINRFKGLGVTLKEVDQNYRRIEDLSALLNWIEHAAELSNDNLESACRLQQSEILKKALHWSLEVNRRVAGLPDEEKIPFHGVQKGLASAHRAADIAVVSSANHQAILEEWKRCGLLKFVDIVLSQDAGSKGYCIRRLLEKGYEKDHVLMVGDAPGDMDAARENGVLYYPILVKREGDSWERFEREGLKRFLEGCFQGKFQEEIVREFENNLR